MAAKLWLYLFCLLTMVFQISRAEPYKNSIEWVDPTSDQALFMQQVPVGRESGKNQFLCRARIDSLQMLPGKLLVGNNNGSCIYPYGGIEIYETNYQVLYYYPGTTSWVKFTGQYTGNEILGGVQNQRNAFICRSVISNQMLVGFLDRFGLTCYIGFEGKMYDTIENFEVLVRNGFGVAIGTTMSQS